MKRKRHSPEEIIKKLREAAGLIAGGKTVEEAAHQFGELHYARCERD
jgi:putative transposase